MCTTWRFDKKFKKTFNFVTIIGYGLIKLIKK